MLLDCYSLGRSVSVTSCQQPGARLASVSKNGWSRRPIAAGCPQNEFVPATEYTYCDGLWLHEVWWKDCGFQYPTRWGGQAREGMKHEATSTTVINTVSQKRRLALWLSVRCCHLASR